MDAAKGPRVRGLSGAEGCTHGSVRTGGRYLREAEEALERAALKKARARTALLLMQSLSSSPLTRSAFLRSRPARAKHRGGAEEWGVDSLAKCHLARLERRSEPPGPAGHVFKPTARQGAARPLSAQNLVPNHFYALTTLSAEARASTTPPPAILSSGWLLPVAQARAGRCRRCQRGRAGPAKGRVGSGASASAERF